MEADRRGRALWTRAPPGVSAEAVELLSARRDGVLESRELEVRVTRLARARAINGLTLIRK